MAVSIVSKILCLRAYFGYKKSGNVQAGNKGDDAGLW